MSTKDSKSRSSFQKREIHGTEIPQFALAHRLPLVAYGGERRESLGRFIHFRVAISFSPQVAGFNVKYFLDIVASGLLLNTVLPLLPGPKLWSFRGRQQVQGHQAKLRDFQDDPIAETSIVVSRRSFNISAIFSLFSTFSSSNFFV